MITRTDAMLVGLASGAIFIAMLFALASAA